MSITVEVLIQVLKNNPLPEGVISYDNRGLGADIHMQVESFKAKFAIFDTTDRHCSKYNTEYSTVIDGVRVFAIEQVEKEDPLVVLQARVQELEDQVGEAEAQLSEYRS